MQDFDVIIVGGGHAGCEAAQAAARMGATPAQQQAAAAEARDSADPMIMGVIAQGMGALNTWLQGANRERVAEIEAQARVQIAQIQAEVERERILAQGGAGGGAPPVHQPAPQPASSGGGVVEIGGLVLLAKLLGLF